MWNKLLALNSFVLLPILAIFMLYSAGHAIMTLEWKMLIFAALLFAAFLIFEVVLSLLSD